VQTLILFGAQYLVALPAVVIVGYIFFLPERAQHKLALIEIISLPVAYALAFVVGIFYFDPRPFVVDHTAPLIAYGSYNGFPSGHTLFAAVAAMTMWYFNRPLGIFLWIIALLVGISRIAAGLHHGVDIAASILIAMAVVWIVEKIVTTFVQSYFT
jgi:undecaprenyl-diphosphatase